LAHCQYDSSPEVLRFLCRKLEPLLAKKLIDAIVPTKHEAFTKTEDLILAVQCLAEVTELNKIDNTARQVLESLCGWFNETGRQACETSSRKEELFEKNAIVAVEKIGKSWPGRDAFLTWISNPHKAVVSDYESSSCAFGRMVAALWSDYEEIRERLIILSHDPTTYILPYMAFDALARSFGNQPETQRLLQHMSMSGQRQNICKAAIRALAKYYTDAPDTLPRLMQIAMESKSDVRNEAIWFLAEYYSKVPDTLLLFKHLATNDQESDIRDSAISALASEYTDAPDILLLFRQVVINEKDSMVRQTAISALAENYTDAPETFPLLWQVITDEQENHEVRCVAVNALAEHYTNVPEILPRMMQIAMHDPDSPVRWTAVEALAEYYTNASDVLPQLQQIAINDPESVVRNDTIRALAENYTHETLPLLRRIATTDDEDKAVRGETLWTLAEYYTEVPETLTLLQQLATHDKESFVCSTALRVLGEYYIDVPDILSWLWQIITNSENACLRREAVGGVIKNYDEILQKLLSQSLDETWPWLDSKELIDEERVNQAAEELELSSETIRQYYENIAQEIPLQLSWLKQAPPGLM